MLPISELSFTSFLVLFISYEYEILFTCKLKTRFHMNGCSPSIALIARLGQSEMAYIDSFINQDLCDDPLYTMAT